MSIARRLRRPAQLCTLVCALLALAGAGAAPAAADPRAQERYYSSYGSPDSSTEPVAQEQYYSSYGAPEPLSPAQSPAPTNDTPWLPIAASLAAALAIATVSATQVRRTRLRRRRTAHTPA